MSFDWHDYIQLAQDLCMNNSGTITEAYDRSIFSRSYYGAYNAASNYLTGQGVNIPRIDAHKFVIDTLLASAIPEENKIGADLQRLKRQRILADYKNNFPANRQDARVHCQMAEQVFNMISALQSSASQPPSNP